MPIGPTISENQNMYHHLQEVTSNMAVCQRHWPENTKRRADSVRLWILRRFLMFQNPFANKLAVVSVRLFFTFYESLTVQHFFIFLH